MESKGFTLIELLTVVSIIGVLSTNTVASLSDTRAQARDARREADIKMLQTAFENYHAEHGHYPYVGTMNNYYSVQTAGNPYTPNTTWAQLSNEMGVTLPVDPINEYVNPYSGGYGYAYYVGDFPQLCNGQAYSLLYNMETKQGDLTSRPNDGVMFCNGTFVEFGNSFVVGVDRDGNMK